jgi:hypothetical protein
MTLDLSSKPSIAGVGLVLDTRQKDAKAVVRAIEREMSEIQGQADRAGGQVRWCRHVIPPVTSAVAIRNPV